MKITALAIAATLAVMGVVYLITDAVLPEAPSEAPAATVAAPEGFNGFEVQQAPPAPPRFIARDQNGEAIHVDQNGNYHYVD